MFKVTFSIGDGVTRSYTVKGLTADEALGKAIARLRRDNHPNRGVLSIVDVGA